MWIPAVLLLWPLVEIALFVTVGSWIGLWPTLAIVIGTGMLGIWLIRRQGLRAGEGIRRAMSARTDPTVVLAKGMLGLGAAVLLILPGFLTDTLGLLLLLPPVRGAISARLSRRAAGVGVVWTKGDPRQPPPEVIDGTWEELPPGETRQPPSGWTRH